MERLFFIDFMRFLAIFFVSAFHVARYIGFDVLNILKYPFMAGGWIGCSLFFMISGYCLCMKYDENVCYFEYLKKRLIRLLPAYYISIIIWYFLIKMGITHKPIGLSAILSHIFLVHNFDNSNFYSLSGVFWFLGVLFDFYLIFPILYKLKKKKYALEIFTFVVFVLSVFISIFFQIKGSVFNKSVLINLPCFVFGMLMYEKKISLNKFFKFLLLVFSILFLIFIKPAGFMGSSVNLVAIIETILIGVLCFSYKDEFSKIPELFKKFIGEIAISSYSIYLYNYIFYAAKPTVKNHTMIFIYMAFVFGFGIVMYKLIEKPVNKVVKNF